jgi:ppGpp synthetase/RelA/SpoT-type nucleotidyltranferase
MVHDVDSTIIESNLEAMAQVDLELIIEAIRSREHELSIYADGVRKFFLEHPKLTTGSFPIVHSVKHRMKNYDHLREKLNRKISDGRSITPDTVLKEITDIGGVRVLHLYQEQLTLIHNVIVEREKSKDWVLDETPKAYTWDPESVNYMEKLGLNVKQKDSFYTSVHYVVRPREGSDIACEIQVRTLFEEIWGEIDHTLNYPNPTESVPCREQLLVLAKLIGAGSRLVDSLFRTLENK